MKTSQLLTTKIDILRDINLVKDQLSCLHEINESKHPFRSYFAISCLNGNKIFEASFVSTSKCSPLESINFHLKLKKKKKNFSLSPSSRFDARATIGTAKKMKFSIKDFFSKRD